MRKYGVLGHFCSIRRESARRAKPGFILSFTFPNQILTTIRIVFDDISGAELAITNMTTLPKRECGNGHGSVAIGIVLKWAKEYGLRDIRAVQVQRESERFWKKNGFSSLSNKTNDFEFVGLTKLPL